MLQEVTIINDINKLIDGLTATLDVSVKKGYKDGLRRSIEVTESEIENTENIAHRIVLESLLERLETELGFANSTN